MKTNENKSSQSQMNSSSSGNQSSSSSLGNSNKSSSSSMSGLNKDNLTQQFQKYSGPIVDKVSSLSTTQKVVGGAIIAAGAGWLAMNPKSRNTVLNKFKKVAANKNDNKSSNRK